MAALKIFAAVCLLTGALIFVFVHRSSADMYKYVDRNGTVCLTNDIKKVPEEYRGQVVVIPEQHDEGKGRPPEKAKKETGREKGKEEGFQWTRLKAFFNAFVRGRFFMPVLAIILYLALFLAIGKVCAALEQRKLSIVLRVVLTLCVLIYLWKAL